MNIVLLLLSLILLPFAAHAAEGAKQTGAKVRA